MKKSELIKLRKLVKCEITKRQQINKYLNNSDVLGFLNLIGESTEKKDLENIREILVEILKDFEVKESNGIYVCTKAYDQDSRAPVIYYTKPDDKCNPDYKCYKDIESGEEVLSDWIYGPSINDFEKRHTVLNPYNTKYTDKEIKENGYEEVRLTFFEENYKNGQNQAIKKILNKYPRI